MLKLQNCAIICLVISVTGVYRFIYFRNLHPPVAHEVGNRETKKERNGKIVELNKNPILHKYEYFFYNILRKIKFLEGKSKIFASAHFARLGLIIISFYKFKFEKINKTQAKNTKVL